MKATTSLADRVLSHRTALVIVLAVAAALRFWGLAFGDPGKYRPDEEYVVSRALGFHSGNLNPSFFIYPTAYMYLLSLVYGVIRLGGEAMGAFGPGGFMAYLEQHRFFPIHLYARGTTAVLGVLGVLATYRLGKHLFGPTAGVLSAAVLAVNYAHVRESHFATTDVPMALLSTLALTALAGVADRGRLRDYALAGALTGAAISTKYPALALGLPFLIAHLAAPRDQMRPWSPRPLALLAAGGLAVVVSFVALSPYFLLDFKTVARDFAFQAPFVRKGIAGAVPLGWRWLFGFALWYGAGPWLEGLFLVAIFVAMVRVFTRGPRWAAGAVVASFAIGLGGSYMASQWVFFRYVVPLMPVLAVLVAGLALEIAAWVSPGQRWLVAALILGLSSFEPAVRAVSTSRLLATPDTRQEAAEWIRSNIPGGTGIATDQAFMYAKPELPPDYRYVHFAELPTHALGWALVDESPIKRFSPPLSDEVRLLLRDRGRLVAKYDPFVSTQSRDQAVFDLADAFYLPLSGLGAVRQPGPVLRLYRLDAAPPPLPSGGRPFGWWGRYFGNVRWEGTPDHVRVDPMIDFEWKPGPPFSAPLYSVEWVGELHVERDGSYGFRIESDDGCFLFIDGQLVVDNGGEHGPLSKTGSAALSPGAHAIQVRYFNSAFTGQVRLYWTPPGGREQLVPADVVRPPWPSKPVSRDP